MKTRYDRSNGYRLRRLDHTKNLKRHKKKKEKIVKKYAFSVKRSPVIISNCTRKNVHVYENEISVLRKSLCVRYNMHTVPFPPLRHRPY